MLEMQQQHAKQQQDLEQQVAMLEQMVRQLMTPEAMSRYMTLKMAHPEKAMQALVLIAQQVQQGLANKITDEAFKELLQRMEPQKKEFRINHK